MVLLAGSASCSFDRGGREADAGPTGVTDSATSVPQTEVIDAGVAPRSARRFQLTAGTSADLSMLVDVSIDQESAGTTQILDTPAVMQQVTVTVTEVSPDGKTAVVGVTLGQIGLDPAGTDLTEPEIADLSAELDALVGLRGSATVGELGEVRDFEYLPPEGASARTIKVLDDVAAQLVAITIPLPREPIGRGARWRARTRSHFGGVTSVQETTYELTAVEGDRLSYRATVVQRALPGDIAPEAPGAGSRARLVSGDMRGTTTGTSDLTDLTATFETDLSGTQVVELDGPGSPTRSTQRLSLTARVEEAG